MYLERLLQINLAALTTLGALLLGMGQRTEAPVLALAAAAILSIWLTDLKGWIRIGPRLGNILMIAAAAISLRRLFPVHSDLQSLDFAWFLIYLQMIILFQPKDQRKYWLLVMFSLLQAIVATLFNQGVWFGLLLVLYMLLGFSAMVLLMIYRQWAPEQPRENGIRAAFESLRNAMRRWIGLDSKAGVAVAAQAEQSARPARWPLAAERAEFTCLPAGDSRTGLGSELFGRLARMALHTMVLTLALFFAVPRFGQTTWQGAYTEPQRVVGFSDTVTLGDLGETIEDADEVMQVRFRDPATRKPVPVHGEIYLQGAILMTYERGRWHAGLPSWDMRTDLLDRPDTLPQRDFVLQEIDIGGLDHGELFYIAPFIPLRYTTDIHFDHARRRLFRSEESRTREFGYRLGTTAIVDGVQRALMPRDPKESTERALQLPGGDGHESLPRLIELAERWIKESGLPESDRLGRAEYLRRKLANSDRFRYSLAGQARNPDLDPIEDFIAEHPLGHCEYFATALALMLRSQKIPARLVIGYKCDEWNPIGGYYQVRQLHAHSWVEVYLRAGQFPIGMTHGGVYWPWLRGAWLRLDPTPEGAGPQTNATWLAPVGGAMDWLNATWSKYIMRLDYERQRDAIYEPISRAVRAAYEAITDPDAWRARFDRLKKFARLDQLGGFAAWSLAVGAWLVVAAMFAGAGWLLWRHGRRLLPPWESNHAAKKRLRRGQVKFYRRFEAVMARQGIVRAAGQTQREFAGMAERKIASISESPALPHLPRVVADAYYRIRFGHEALDKQEVEAVEHAIRELSEIGTSKTKLKS